MTTSTATVLFCDIVSSTALRADLGEVAADRFFRETERHFRTIVTGSGGRVLKGAGDGIMAVFDSASDAVSGAVALHRSKQQIRNALEIRVGVASGDVTWEGDDCFGMPVVVAARLESACEPGAILVAGIVRYLAGDRVQTEYRSVGSLDLEGIPEPVDAFEVSWELPDSDDLVTWAFPACLPRRSEQPFVGRAVELAALLERWTDLGPDQHAGVLLAGEAGAGKTRLATELARRCHLEGAIVVAGSCDRELSLPYQPWVMALDQLVAQLPAAFVEEAKSELVDLAVLLPHVEHLVNGSARVARSDPEVERLRMFEATAGLFARAARIAPVLIVLDDLHWAGSQTLGLLRYLLRTRPVPRSMIIGTLRDTDDEISHPLAETLAELRRVEAAHHHRLTGISSDAVHELLDATGSIGDARTHAEVIAERTRGNAFLVTELVRNASDGIEAVPASVMDVVKVRLLQLDADARTLANLIAVAGRLELAVLVEITRSTGGDLALALRDLTGSDLVHELGGDAPVYQFSHALIRDAVTQSLPGVERAELHRVVAVAIEQVHTADRRQVLAELTRHFVAASSLAGWHKAAYYGRRAAAHARRTAAYEEAIDLIELALDVTPGGTEERARLLIDIVDLLERSGRNPEAVRFAEQADDTAVEIADLVLQARASIELERAAHLANAELDRSLPRLRRVLRSADRLPEQIGVQALASLGRALWLNGATEGPDLTVRALAAARSLGDDETLSHALEMSILTEDDPRIALGLTRELDALTTQLGKVFQSMWAMTRQTDALIMLGRLAEAETVLIRLHRAAERYRFTNYRYIALVFSHTLALAAADFDQAERATEAANTAEQVEFVGLDASGAFGLQMFMIRRAQGRLEEMRPVLQLIAGNEADGGVWRPGLVLAYTELGMIDEAHAALDELLCDDLADLPRDTLWPLSLMFLADAGASLDRGDLTAILIDELEALAGLTIRAGYTTNGGPADRCRAAVAELAGHRRIADRCIAEAHALATSSASPLWLAMVESTWAWILDRRDDCDAAAEHLDRALRLAEAHGIGCIPDRLSRGTTAPKGREVSSPSFDGHLHDLSAREVEVLAALCDGCTNREIAERLFISPNTAANHVRSILQKTQSANRTEAAAFAFRHGLASTFHT